MVQPSLLLLKSIIIQRFCLGLVIIYDVKVGNPRTLILFNHLTCKTVAIVGKKIRIELDGTLWFPPPQFLALALCSYISFGVHGSNGVLIFSIWKNGIDMPAFEIKEYNA